MSIGTNEAIVVADKTPANVTYSEVSNTGALCVYSDRTRALGVPRTITISHQLTGSGDTARRRSLVKFALSVENPNLAGDVVTMGLHVVYDVPLRIVDKDDISDVQVQLVNLIESANFIDKICNAEV